MEAMSSVYCPRCGAPTAPSDRYCGNCGIPAVLTPGYVPYMPMAQPSHDRTGMIVVIVIVVVLVGTVGMSALMYVLVSGLIAAPPTIPIALGVRVSRSADGTNWTLTFTSVPANVNPAITYLTLVNASSAPALPPTSFSSLTGGMLPLAGGFGSVYARYTGFSNMLATGDYISIGTTTSLGASTAGYQGQISFAGSILWAGTLQ